MKIIVSADMSAAYGPFSTDEEVDMYMKALGFVRIESGSKTGKIPVRAKIMELQKPLLQVLT